MSGPEAQQPEPLCCKTNFLHGARACIFDDEGFPQTHPLIEVAGADLAAEIKCQNEYKYTYVYIYIYILFIYIYYLYIYIYYLYIYIHIIWYEYMHIYMYIIWFEYAYIYVYHMV